MEAAFRAAIASTFRGHELHPMGGDSGCCVLIDRHCVGDDELQAVGHGGRLLTGCLVRAGGGFVGRVPQGGHAGRCGELGSSLLGGKSSGRGHCIAGLRLRRGRVVGWAGSGAPGECEGGTCEQRGSGGAGLHGPPMRIVRGPSCRVGKPHAPASPFHGRSSIRLPPLASCDLVDVPDAGRGLHV